jgi:hypothetical protein
MARLSKPAAMHQRASEHAANADRKPWRCELINIPPWVMNTFGDSFLPYFKSGDRPKYNKEMVRQSIPGGSLMIREGLAASFSVVLAEDFVRNRRSSDFWLGLPKAQIASGLRAGLTGSRGALP